MEVVQRSANIKVAKWTEHFVQELDSLCAFQEGGVPISGTLHKIRKTVEEMNKGRVLWCIYDGFSGDTEVADLYDTGLMDSSVIWGTDLRTGEMFCEAMSIEYGPHHESSSS